MSALFSADSIGRSFGKKDVLKSATATAHAGRISAIMGRNGSGKTTLLRCALGLRALDYGTVRYDGTAYQRPRLWQLAANGLFFLPDRGLLGKRMTVDQQIRLIEGRYPEADSSGVAERLEVAHLLDHTARTLSGGERRRAELALAITRRPRCLIADEPLTEVEPKDRAVVARALRDLADAGCAILVTGHEVEDLFELADDVIWMAAGTTHGLGSPDRAREHAQFQREYLGTVAR